MSSNLQYSISIIGYEGNGLIYAGSASIILPKGKKGILKVALLNIPEFDIAKINKFKLREVLDKNFSIINSDNIEKTKKSEEKEKYVIQTIIDYDSASVNIKNRLITFNVIIKNNTPIENKIYYDNYYLTFLYKDALCEVEIIKDSTDLNESNQFMKFVIILIVVSILLAILFSIIYISEREKRRNLILFSNRSFI